MAFQYWLGHRVMFTADLRSSAPQRMSIRAFVNESPEGFPIMNLGKEKRSLLKVRLGATACLVPLPRCRVDGITPTIGCFEASPCNPQRPGEPMRTGVRWDGEKQAQSKMRIF